MSPGDLTEVPCPQCGQRIRVEAEWRLVPCPACGRIVSRMEIDPSYD